MEQGRGSSFLEKGVLQNGDIWIPSTPHKLVLQSTNNALSEIRHNHIGSENWLSLGGMYEDTLQNKQPHSFDLNISVSPSFGEQKHEVPPIENCSSRQQNSPQTGILGMNGEVQSSPNVASIEPYNMFPLNSGVNYLELNNRNVGKLQKLGSLNHNAGRSGTYLQNLGEVVNSQEVNSFADFMSNINAKHSPPANESLYRSSFCEDIPTITRPVSQVVSNNPYASVGVRAQQNHILHGSNHVAYATVGAGFPQTHVHYDNHDGGCYNRQEIPSSRPSMDKYASNMTPRSEAREFSSASRSLPIGSVTPDQQKQFMTHWISPEPQLLIENASTPEKYVQGKAALSSEPEKLEKEYGDGLAKSMGTTTAVAAIVPQEMGCSDGGDAGFDLNKTPQSPKHPSTKSCGPDGNPPAKRKYMWKIDSKNLTPPVTDRVEVIEVSDAGPATKSCKRKSNFEETVADNTEEKEGQGSRLDHQEQNNEWHKLRMESSGASTSAATTYDKERQQSPAAYNFVQSINNVLPQEPTPPESAALTPTSRDHSLNVVARSLSMRNARIHQSNGKSTHNQVHHHSNHVCESHPFEQNFGFRSQSSVQTTPQVLEDLVDVTDKQGAKRAYKPTVSGSPQDVTFTGSQIQPRGIPGLETCNIYNIKDKFIGASFNMHSGSTTAEEISQQFESRRNESLLAEISTGTQNTESKNSDYRKKAMNVNPNDNSSYFFHDRYMNYPDMRHKFQQQHALSQGDLCSESTLPVKPPKFADTKITKSTTTVINGKESSSARDPQPIPMNGNINSPLHPVVNKRTPYKKDPVVQQLLQQEPENKKTCGKSSKKFEGNIVDDIINGMKHLQITSSGKESALFPYKGDDAAVPYNLVKKRKPRPRVNIDPETTRLWNLLMAGESAETIDTDKEKWWEEERMFRCRVDSFIARMHLIQGDRRFSKWKGSVVDSVIGAFLTQNVSDQLSSSAFMSLAARFPLKSDSAENGASLNKGLELRNDSLDESVNRNIQHSIKHMSVKPTDNSKCTEIQTEMGQGQSPPDKLSSKIGVTTSPAGKRKAEKEKAEPFNWDTLRKQVQSKAGTTGRSREAMDSLDYETMRTADVHEISDAIKEMDMNHILAERMKNFLNRLVEDHERIDLEWLRDVEPDRAKDYLLSIRGLGLKSVECIRLLTLHHLAFPVDTNVGRIAVRLGWVPLQPLPESLELHLLEIYPILESIQKYLWPRLCKLDQETLYELYNQMKTFGMVFCTKRDPNCNVCPMRAECRHFASAYASARRGLPGRQERQREVEERDIEDAFYEDPDEIPVIKLSMEELTFNVQSFIQEQIEIGEDDMSKAQVALNPAFASLPAPKLKHVNRMRTEHRV